MSLRSRLVVLVCLGALLLVAAELIIRSRYAEQLMIYERPDIYRNGALGHRYRPNSQSKLCIPSICKTVVINEHGFYGPSFARRTEAGRRRIAVLGASDAARLYLNGDRSYSVVLEELLTREGVAVEVLNFATDGVGRGLADLLIIEEEVMGFAPDLILMNPALPFPDRHGRREYYRGYSATVGTADMSDSRLAAIRRGREAYVDALIEWSPTRAYEVSYLVRAAHRGLMQRAMRDGAEDFAPRDCEEHPIEVGQSWVRDLYAFQRRKVPCALVRSITSFDESLDRLVLTKRRVEAAGSELFLFDYEQISDELRQALDSRSLSMVGLNIPKNPALAHRFEGHYNEEGHLLVAQRLFDALGPRWRQWLEF